ncbi:thioredoxin family protein [Varunaivibrio sulfuroxidans]|uniref:Thioredoxin n=1 Tax=Varunaivibrio sulfuroxidans TaxID=1773489 RepID=A0A4R3J2V4_9PROT|nr:thioredoxin domain-containing protein [Varunaivibrio sulfuroxidans]TCS60149.1 thioredoxin [Varunaivibrio sulfuroxidans]WES30879.1 thioredoxin domain-containing protein [Varunaivibrio sulfuroxidans]
MATIELTQGNLESTIKDNDILLIDFWAGWCGPCKSFAPVFEAASEKHPSVTFAKCDTEAEQMVASQFGIRSIPTLAIFREQILLYSQPGALPESALEELIGQVTSLDMEEVRAKVAEAQAQEAAGAGQDQDA